MSSRDGGAVGESLQIRVTDSETGRVRHHLIQIDGEWVDLADPKTKMLVKLALINYLGNLNE